MRSEADNFAWVAATLGVPVSGCTAAVGGRNARVFRLDLADGRRVALKRYPRHPWDEVDRYARERDTLHLLERMAPDRSPRWLGGDDTTRCALLSWLDGTAQPAPTRADLADALAFAGVLLAASTPGQPQYAACRDRFAAASAACTDRAALVAQIAQRRQRLDTVGELHAFLQQGFDPVHSAALARTADAQPPLAASELRIVAADLGFHNALYGSDGRWRYLDFEYVGWDDPVRLFADLALHPGHHLAAADRRWLLAATAATPGIDAAAAARLAAFLPLYALRWAAIALNEFLPERRAARTAAGWPEQPESWHDLRRQQLARAEHLVNLARYSLDTGTLP